MATQRIKCQNPDCKRIFAHLVGDNTVEIVRKANRAVTTGQNYSIIGTCSECPEQNAIICNDGKVDTSDLTLLAMKEKDDAHLGGQQKEDGQPGVEDDSSPAAGSAANSGSAGGEQPEDNGSGSPVGERTFSEAQRRFTRKVGANPGRNAEVLRPDPRDAE